MNEKRPSYQWYPRHILASQRVALLNLKQEAAYRRALDFCWIEGSLPADEVLLATVIGKKCTPKLAASIKHMFISHPDDPTRLIHDRQEEEREKQDRFREKQSENGKKGGRGKKKVDPEILKNDSVFEKNGDETGKVPEQNEDQKFQPQEDELIDSQTETPSDQKGLGLSGLSQTIAKKSSPSPSPSPTTYNAAAAAFSPEGIAIQILGYRQDLTIEQATIEAHKMLCKESRPGPIYIAKWAENISVSKQERKVIMKGPFGEVVWTEAQYAEQNTNSTFKFVRYD